MSLWYFDKEMCKDHNMDPRFFEWLRKSRFKHCYNKSNIHMAYEAWQEGRSSK